MTTVRPPWKLAPPNDPWLGLRAVHPVRVMLVRGAGDDSSVALSTTSPRSEEPAMGLMFRRRRPVARLAAGAATAGIAYKAGKRHAQEEAPPDDGAESAAPAPPPAAAPSSEMGDLNRLVELHSSGGLSDEEFAAAKAKLLGL